MVPSKFMQEQAAATTDEKDNGESSISNVQLWNGFTRPGILMPTDPRFQQFSDLYYAESVRLFGKADYYSMDPFHEAANLPADLDLKACFQAVNAAMKKANPKAKWVCQGWSENPRPEMLEAITPGDVIFLDLFSECRPMWGMPSLWYKENGYELPHQDASQGKAPCGYRSDDGRFGDQSRNVRTDVRTALAS